MWYLNVAMAENYVCLECDNNTKDESRIESISVGVNTGIQVQAPE